MIKKIFCHILILSLITALFHSCAKDLKKSSSSDDLVIYPSPPDTTRVQYLTSINSSADIKGKQSAINQFIFGEEIPKIVVKPFGIAMSGSKIYLCDTGIGGLILIDLSDNSFEYFIPSGKGQLQLPLNTSVDDNGFLYVADGNRRQIVVFDNDLKYSAAFGETTDIFKPTDITLNRNKAFVVSVKDQRVFVYDKNDFRKLNSFPSSEAGDDGYLYQPTNIAVDDDYVYVSDVGDNKVKIYSHEGIYISSLGGYGNQPGQLMRPKGVAVDNESNIYVVDAAFENTQIFNSKGNILMFFGGPYRKHGDMWLPADVLISYTALEFFDRYVDPSFSLKYLIFVTNQYGPDKVNVYGFVGPSKK